jgi:DNA-binding beta-propeller fold protein YncE
MSPHGKTIVLVDAKLPQMVVDTKRDEIARTVQLEGHEKAAQIARYSPDGKYLVVTSFDAPLGTIFDAKLETQRLLQLGRGPMNMAFHADGRILLTANHNAGSLAVVDLEQAEVLRTVPAGVGVEILFGAARPECLSVAEETMSICADSNQRTRIDACIRSAGLNAPGTWTSADRSGGSATTLRVWCKPCVGGFIGLEVSFCS